MILCFVSHVSGNKYVLNQLTDLNKSMNRIPDVIVTFQIFAIENARPHH